MWDDNLPQEFGGSGATYESETPSFAEDGGITLTAGRGFAAFEDEDDSFSGRGSRGGRGGRGGRGFGGGRGGRGGGFRDGDRNGYGGDSNSHDDDNQENGFGGGRGRGGRGGRGGARGGGGDRGDRGENGDGAPEKPRELYIPPEPTNDENEMFCGGISSGINFRKYDNIKIQVSGENVPKPIDSFENSGLRPYLLENIKKSGYKVPTPIQKTAIPVIMAQRDVMGCAQTGSGKTAAFLVPIIDCLLKDQQDMVVTPEGCCQPHVVIISPTRELTMQIHAEARKFAHGSVIKTCLIYGGTAVRYQAENVTRGCHILVATPGRLLDFVERNRVNFSSVRFVVLDEADRMLDMGFMKDVERMMNHATMPAIGERCTLMFSATFPDDIQELARKFLHNYVFTAVGIVGGACADVEQAFHEVSKYSKRDKLMELLQEQEVKGILVFVETKRNADFLASLLCEKQLPTTSIHGDRLQRERELALADFKSGRCSILVATGVAARGLDIKNVMHVINYDMPKSIDEYVHRIGRTGRVGNAGRASSFYDPSADASIAGDLVKILKQAEQPVPDFLSNADGGGSYRPRQKFGGEDIRDIQKDSFVNEPEEMW